MANYISAAKHLCKICRFCRVNM